MGLTQLLTKLTIWYFWECSIDFCSIILAKQMHCFYKYPIEPKLMSTYQFKRPLWHSWKSPNIWYPRVLLVFRIVCSRILKLPWMQFWLDATLLWYSLASFYLIFDAEDTKMQECFSYLATLCAQASLRSAAPARVRLDIPRGWMICFEVWV